MALCTEMDAVAAQLLGDQSTQGGWVEGCNGLDVRIAHQGILEPLNDEALALDDDLGEAD